MASRVSHWALATWLVTFCAAAQEPPPTPPAPGTLLPASPPSPPLATPQPLAPAPPPAPASGQPAPAPGDQAPAPARGAEPKAGAAGSSSTPKRVVRKAPKPEPPPSFPRADLKLTVAPTEDGTRWRMRIANDGSAAVAVVADARLLSLSFDRGEKKKPVICSFPASIRTFDLDARTLVMGPGKSYSESFDPRALCFSRAEAAVLAEGGTVTPLLGWAAREKRPSPPYVASGTAEHVVAPEVVLRGPPVSVDRSSIEKLEPVLPQPAAAPTQGPDPLATRLWLTSEPRVDAATSREVPIAVTVKNIGARPATFRFRADTLTFELVNERGTVTSCQSLRRAPPIRELFRTLQPGQSASTMLLLDVACPHRALDEPGLYAVKATLDTRQASGAPVAVRTFDGVVEASNRTLLRIRQPRRATLSEPPTLE